MTQEEKFAARLKQLLSESGLHEIVVFVNADLTISFWIVKSNKVEGEKRAIISLGVEPQPLAGRADVVS